jgi:hypothetical protein
VLGEVLAPGIVQREVVEPAEKREEKHGLQHEVDRAEPAGGAEAVGRMASGKLGGGSGVQEFGLDAQDAEDQREHRAAEIEDELARIHDAAGESHRSAG